MRANTDSKTLKMTNQDENRLKWKAWAEVSDWTVRVHEAIASKLQALLVSCWIGVREKCCHSATADNQTNKCDWAMLKVDTPASGAATIAASTRPTGE